MQVSEAIIRIRAQKQGQQCVEDVGELIVPLVQLMHAKDTIEIERWYQMKKDGRMVRRMIDSTLRIRLERFDFTLHFIFHRERFSNCLH